MAQAVDFSEFEGLSKADWKVLVEKELKGKAFEQHLLGHFLGEIDFPAYHTNEDLGELSIHQSVIQNALNLYGKKQSEKSYSILVEDERQANKIALQVLEQGASALNFSLSKSPDLKVLLKDIDCALITIGFNCTGNIFQTICSQAEQFKNGSVYWEVNPFASGFSIKDSISFYAKSSSELSKAGAKFSICFSFDGLAEAGANLSTQIALIGLFHQLFLKEAAGSDHGVELIETSMFSHAFSPLVFPEIAKSRALNVMLAGNLASIDENLNARKTRGIRINPNTVFLGSNDPEVNLIRLTSFCFAAYAANPAIIGLRNYRLNKEEGTAKTSINVATVLEEESHLAHYSDPCGGSYYVEKLTQLLLEKALEFQRRYTQNSWQEVLDSKTLKEELAKQAKALNALHKEEQLIRVGENLFPPQGKNQIEELALKAL